MLNYVLSYGSHTVFFLCLIWLSSMFGGVIAVCLWVSHSCCWCRGEWPRHTWKLLTEWNVMTEDLSMAYLQGLCKGIDEELVAGMHVCLFLFLVGNIVLGPQIHENGDLMARSSEMKSRSKKWNLIPLRYQNMYYCTSKITHFSCGRDRAGGGAFPASQTWGSMPRSPLAYKHTLHVGLQPPHLKTCSTVPTVL